MQSLLLKFIHQALFQSAGKNHFALQDTFAFVKPTAHYLYTTNMFFLYIGSYCLSMSLKKNLSRTYYAYQEINRQKKKQQNKQTNEQNWRNPRKW